MMMMATSSTCGHFVIYIFEETIQDRYSGNVSKIKICMTQKINHTCKLILAVLSHSSFQHQS